jgi:hypothetical protein
MNFLQNLTEILSRLLQGLFTQNRAPASSAEETQSTTSETDVTLESQQIQSQRPAVEAPPASQVVVASDEPVLTPSFTETVIEQPLPTEQPLPGEIDVGQTPAVITVRVKLLVYNPKLPDERTLIATLHFHEPEQLSQEMIADLKQVSNGILNYEIVERQTMDALPKKIDGFVYSPQDYVDTFRARLGFHEPDAVDYNTLLQSQNLSQGIPSMKSGCLPRHIPVSMNQPWVDLVHFIAMLHHWLGPLEFPGDFLSWDLTMNAV